MAHLDSTFLASSSTSTFTFTSHGNTNSNCYVFDVFLNHRGPDVKTGLASHIYRRLILHGLRVFFDIGEMQQGENLTPQIEGAIRTASVHVTIFSRRYAQSPWCLKELALILESGSTIIPVFYHVDPSELRWTQLGGDGEYAQALHTLGKKRTSEGNPRHDSDTIKRFHK